MTLTDESRLKPALENATHTHDSCPLVALGESALRETWCLSWAAISGRSSWNSPSTGWE
jgi:hypothetical protein